MNKRIVGIDMATSCGYATIINNQLISGTWDFSNSKKESKLNPGRRYLKFYNTLRSFISEYKIECVYYEDWHFARSYVSGSVLAGFRAILQLVCEELKIPYYPLEISDIKSYISGNSKATKTEIVNAINKLGIEVENEDEADAISVYILAQYKEKGIK